MSFVPLVNVPPLQFPIDDYRFSTYINYLTSVISQEYLHEPALQSAIAQIAGTCIGTVPYNYHRSVGRLLVNETSNLDDLLVGPNTAKFEDQRIPSCIIKWRDEVKKIVKAKSSSPSASRTSRTSASHRSGIRIPDLTVTFQPAPHLSLPVLVLMVIELKVWNFVDEPGSQSTRTTQWRRGMAQALLYLAQSSDHCGTFLGLCVLRTEFSRLLVSRDREILVELKAARTEDQHTQWTVQEVMASASSLCERMPHDLVPAQYELDDISQCVSEPAFRTLWDHLALARHIVGTMDCDNIPSNLSWDLLPAGAYEASRGTSHANIGDLDNSRLDEILHLAATAHPKDFPRWWVSAKQDLILAGRPDEEVPRSAYKPSRGSGQPRTGSGGDNAGDRDGDGRAGGSGGNGHNGHNGNQGYDGNDNGHGGDNEHGGPSRDGSGTFGSHWNYHSRTAQNVPTTEASQSEPSPGHSPPYSDDEQEAVSRHSQLWMLQQQRITGPATPDNSPPRHDAVPPLYSVEESFASGTFDARQLVSYDSDEESDRVITDQEIESLAAQVTLLGWRVSFVDSQGMDRSIARRMVARAGGR